MEDKSKECFVAFYEWADILETLPDSVQAKFFRCIFHYAKTGELKEEMNPVEMMAWKMIQSTIDRQQAKYQRVCGRRREAGKRGADARWKNDGKCQNNDGKNGKCQNNDGKAWQSMAIENENENENENTLESVCINSALSREAHTPSLSSVLEYSKELGIEEKVSKKFFSLYAPDWTDKNGRPIKNWKLKLRSFNETEKATARPSGAPRSAREQKYEEFKATTSTGGLAQYVQELKAAKNGDEKMRKKYPEWEQACKKRGI